MTIVRRIRSLVGSDAVLETDGTGPPRVAPRSEEEAALILRTASEAGWRVRIEGARSWSHEDAPADVALTTQRLSDIPYLDPADLVATAQAGVRWNDLRGALADQGAWVALESWRPRPQARCAARSATCATTFSGSRSSPVTAA
jgi:FAD/FMN-containing dehydrogenase